MEKKRCDFYSETKLKHLKPFQEILICNMRVIYLLDILLIVTCWFRIEVHDGHFSDKHHPAHLHNVVTSYWIHTGKRLRISVWIGLSDVWPYRKISSCETRQKVIIKLVSSAVAPNIYRSKSLRCCTQSFTDWWLQQWCWPLLSIMGMEQFRRDFSRRVFR